MKILRLVSTVILTIFLSVRPSGAQDPPKLLEVPEGLAPAQHADLTAARAALVTQEETLAARIAKFNDACRSVERGSARSQQCQKEQKEFVGEIGAHRKAVEDFNERVRRSRPAAIETRPPVSGAMGLMSEREEADLGLKMSEELESRMTLVQDRQVVDYVQRLVEKLAQGSGRPNLHFTVAVCIDCAVPLCFFACALAGGHVYINRALLESGQPFSVASEAELAAILGHEVAHVTARHQAQNADDYARSVGLGVLTSGPLWPVIQSAIFTKFKRDQESEADRLSVEMMYQAGVRPPGLITYFDRLSRGRSSSSIWQNAYDAYLGSHPSEQRRIQDLNPYLADPRYNRTSAADSPDFARVRQRLAVLP